MNPYPNYKPSGIEWIGEIPRHWDVKKLKNLAKILNGQDHKGVWDENGKYPIIGTGGEFGRANQYLHEGPSVILGRKGTIDKPQFMESPFWSVDTAYFTDIYPQTNPKFFFYCCKTILFDLYKYGSAVPSMTQETLNQIQFATPPKPEQSSIANFLDDKTAQIAKLISNKQKLIHLLKEERTAVINEAVSGEGKNWERKKLKFLLKEVKGALKPGPFGSDLKNSDVSPIGPIKVYTQRNVIDEDFEIGEDFISEEKFNALSAFEVYENEILVTTRGTIGRTAIIPKGAKRGIIHPCLIKMQIDNSKVLNDWLIIFFNESSFFHENVKLNSNSTIIDVIYGYTLREVIIPVPPLLEQSAIVHHIQTETRRIDTTISKIEKEIELMNEYRTALISEVVTGKLDVRDYKNKNPEAYLATAATGNTAQT